MKRLKKIFRLFLLIWMVGHSGFALFGLQAFAWVQMTRSLSQVMPMDEAVEFILEGREICGICSFVDEQQDLQQHAEWLTLSLEKPLLLSLVDCQLPSLSRPEIGYLDSTYLYSLGCDVEPLDTPPPKVSSDLYTVIV